jgi:hypothetical protein
MRQVTSDHVRRLRAYHHENSAIHVEDDGIWVGPLDHCCESSVCSFQEVDWDLSDEEIAEWINNREVE